MKDKELESNIDSLMELSSRIRCIGELSEFAVAQLHFYQEKNKDKGVIDLLEILNAGVEKREEIRDVYMERHYRGFCSYLQDCLNEAHEELDQLGLRLSFIEDSSLENQ